MSTVRLAIKDDCPITASASGQRIASTSMSSALQMAVSSGVTEGYCLDAGCGDGALVVRMGRHYARRDPDVTVINPGE